MDIVEKSINYLKSLSAEIVSNAKSGHTGTALGASSIMFSLFHNHLKFNPKDTNFLNRDRLVFSAGHASALYYSLLHLFGYNLSIDDLKNFRAYGSKTPGHPEYPFVPGVEVTTGPLGQGVANAVGLAIGEEIMAARFNTKDFEIFNNYTYCLAGDGCLMEGVAMEACSVAGTLGLSKFILLYDDNEITIDGSRNIANSENVEKKFKAMGFNVIVVEKGNNYYSCDGALKKAKNSNKPTIIIFKTIIGIGTSKEGTNAVHAMPLSAEELAEFKQKLGISESFYVPDDVYDYCRQVVANNTNYYNEWNEKLNRYKLAYPEKYGLLEKFLKFKDPTFKEILTKLCAKPDLEGRNASFEVMNEIAKVCPNLVGGNADLQASTKAYIAGSGNFSKENRLAKNICFGVREHAMGSICNGIARYSNFLVFDSTFLAFSNYMLPAIKMRGLMNLPVISIFSHDNIEVGQDGPTHQPIEQIAQLRSLIGVKVFRPATYSELVAVWKYFISKKSPVALICSKSKIICDKNHLTDAMMGAYVYCDTAPSPTIQIISTGRELKLALDVANKLTRYGVRVISMPCEKLFDEQSEEYKNSVLLSKPKLSVVIEASNDTVWYKYLGKNDLIINVDKYQYSGNGSEVYTKAGFNVDCILEKIQNKLSKK